ncbi:MAG: FAD-dependent oxidoreductase [Gammaproteobacteria bacterium]
MQCAADAADCNRMERALQAYDLPAAVARLLNPTELSEVAGIPLPYHGVWFPGGGWLEPRSLCQAWLQQAGITTRYNAPVQRLEYADGQWQVFDQNGLLSQSPVLIWPMVWRPRGLPPSIGCLSGPIVARPVPCSLRPARKPCEQHCAGRFI